MTNTRLAVFTALLAILVAAAQNTVSVRGTVTAVTGGIIAGATVELVDVHGRHLSTQTDARGHYRIANVTPGVYTLVVGAQGFAPSMRSINVGGTSVQTADAALSLVLHEEVTVHATPHDLSSITLHREAIESLPRDPSELLLRLSRIAGGAAPSGLAIYVDGYRETGALPSKDEIESIRISSNSFAAEFAEPGSARVDVTTRPAGNAVHGELNFYYNSSALNERNAFALVKPPSTSRNYSAVVGGPLVRDRSSYLLEAGTRQEQSSSFVNATVLNGSPLVAEPFIANVPGTGSETHGSLRTDFKLDAKNTLNLRAGYARDNSKNVGFDTGFDLPERGVDRTGTSVSLRSSLTSILSDTRLNELRLELGSDRSTTQARTTSPEVVVFNAFTGGGNQRSLFKSTRAERMHVEESTTGALGKQTVKAGVTADAIDLDDVDRSNFGGTFTFGSAIDRGTVMSPLDLYRRALLGIARPSQFTITRGDPRVRVSQWQGAVFVDDDYAVLPSLTLSGGLRYEQQTNVAGGNVAPRAALAWSPSSSLGTLRVGSGIFYQRVDIGLTVDALRYDGERLQEVVIDQPSFFPSVPPNVDAAQAMTIIRRKARDLVAPRAFVTTASYEHELPANMSMAFGYTEDRGRHLLRSRDISATRATVLQFESTGRSNRHELSAAVQGSFTNGVAFYTRYALGFANADTANAYTLPANSYDLGPEYGRADWDHRHSFYGEAYFTIPGGIKLAPNVYIASAAPFNITTGLDNNGDTSFTDRPAFANPGDPGAIVTPYGTFDPNPRPGHRIIPHNYGRGATEATVNLTAMRSFGRRFRPTFTVEIYNLLNRANKDDFNGVLTSPQFGTPHSAGDPRRIFAGVTLGF